jgi:two-component system sensor histidine kinase KdpD
MTQRGQLRVYLGAAPGVGKTYAMLDEARRRVERGTDVVVGFVETHDRPHTKDMLEGLEVLPRRHVTYRGAVLTELDLPAALARAPQVMLIDEMAHTNVPGLEHEKRWQDIEALLEAGIDVVSTVNVQHLESLNDVVEAIAGIPQRETVPDAVVRSAEQIELVDMTPEALRRRMAHGNIYKADKVDAALSNYFRPGNLTALRELALLWLAGSVDQGLKRYREQHGIAATWETRERVVVALTGGPEGETLVRRAARIAARASGGDLLAVHVTPSDGLVGSSQASLEQQRTLVESLGGSYHQVAGDDVSKSVLDFARANNATQIVIGASRRNPVVAGLTGPGTGMAITRGAGAIDVHIISHEYVGRARVLPRIASGVTARRKLAAVVVGAVLIAVLTAICAAARGSLSLSTDMLLLLFVVVLVSLIGGWMPAVAAAIVSSLVLNYFFVPPIHRFTISQPENVLALVVFLLVASLVSRVVDDAARRASEASRSNAEAETLATLTGSLLRGEQAVPALLQRVQEAFAVSSVTLLRRETGAPSSKSTDTVSANPRGGMRGTWTRLDSVGEDPCSRPEDGDVDIPVGDDLLLVLRGRRLAAEDHRLVNAFATQLAVAYEQRRLAEAAAVAAPIVEADKMRSALLNAVGHDLRTPIATAKAAVSGLLSEDVSWSDADRRELLKGANDSLDRLTELVTDLLDLSRVQAGAMQSMQRPVGLEDVVSRALDHVTGSARRDSKGATQVRVAIPDGLPEVLADGVLLERVVANVVDNAIRYAPAGTDVDVTASVLGDRLELRVIDQGPGIPVREREAVFKPFQRLDDFAAENSAGVGLGLAIARAFVEAMHGTLVLDDTPGGGLTAVVGLPVATSSSP